MKTNIQAYRQLCAIADTVKWPEQHKNDVYQIDRAILTGAYGIDAPESFGWILRDYGTHLIDPRWHGQGSWTPEALRTTFSGQSYCAEDCRFYWYAYGKLVEYDLETWLDHFTDWRHHYNCYRAVCPFCQ